MPLPYAKPKAKEELSNSMEIVPFGKPIPDGYSTQLVKYEAETSDVDSEGDISARYGPIVERDEDTDDDDYEIEDGLEPKDSADEDDSDYEESPIGSRRRCKRTGLSRIKNSSAAPARSVNAKVPKASGLITPPRRKGKNKRTGRQPHNLAADANVVRDWTQAGVPWTYRRSREGKRDLIRWDGKS
jgi:hypothetical protein